MLWRISIDDIEGLGFDIGFESGIAAGGSPVCRVEETILNVYY
jgi:hypothetical protein